MYIFIHTEIQSPFHDVLSRMNNIASARFDSWVKYLKSNKITYFLVNVWDTFQDLWAISFNFNAY